MQLKIFYLLAENMKPTLITNVEVILHTSQISSDLTYFPIGRTLQMNLDLTLKQKASSLNLDYSFLK